MWNETGMFRVEFSRKIRNGPRFKMRWNLFHFVPFFELIWNVSVISDETERNLQHWPQLQPTVRKTAEIDIYEKSKNCILNIHFKCSHWSSEKWESFDRKSSVFLYLCQWHHLYMMRLPFLLYLLYFHQKKILLRNLTKYGANKRSSAIFLLLSFSLYFT